MERFRCKCGCGELVVSDELLEKLRLLEGNLGEELKIMSGFRCKEWNEKVKGVPTSSHLRGLAMDVACLSDRMRWDLVRLGYLVGFKRIGIGKNFIHFDLDGDKGQGVIWVY